jgi:hypothetical protein
MTNKLSNAFSAAVLKEFAEQAPKMREAMIEGLKAGLQDAIADATSDAMTDEALSAEAESYLLDVFRDASAHLEFGADGPFVEIFTLGNLHRLRFSVNFEPIDTFDEEDAEETIKGIDAFVADVEKYKAALLDALADNQPTKDTPNA